MPAERPARSTWIGAGVLTTDGPEAATQPCPHPAWRRLTDAAAALSPGACDPRRLLARRDLPPGRPDLPARQPAAAPAVAPRARQTPPARPLGHHAGPELRVRPPEPGHLPA